MIFYGDLQEIQFFSLTKNNGNYGIDFVMENICRILLI